jgi:anti-sigma factor RsiW
MMPACEDRQMLLNGLLDGELDAANTGATEAHLATCRDCRDEFARLETLRRAIATSGARYGAPDTLRSRIESTIGEEATESRKPRIPTWALSGLGGALAASLAMLLVLPQVRGSQLDDELISGHVRSLQVAHLTDVQTSNEHLVRPWFNGKIDFAPPVPELSTYGFPLAGGRLDYVHGRTVPALVYKRRLHTINLFVWPAPADANRHVEKDGYALEEWSEGGLRYAAVSDVAPAELDQFRAAFERSTGG